MLGVVFSTIADVLAWEEQVSIVIFGTIATRTRNAGTARNLRTGESIAVATPTVPTFKAAVSLRGAVNTWAA